MKYLFLLTGLIICSISFGQIEFCKPKKIDRVANKLIRKLSREDFNAVMMITKDSAVDNQLFMVHKRNIRELKPIFNYLISKGCDRLLVDNLEEVILEYTYYKMHKIDTCMSDLLQPYLDIQFARREKYKKNIIADSIDGVYIPQNIEECFFQIDIFLADSIKVKVKKMTEAEYRVSAHFGLGSWIRNNWGLWGGSRLKTYFNEMGIFHPDDMSGIILNSYHRYINNNEIKLEEQIKYYQDYWKRQNEKEEIK